MGNFEEMSVKAEDVKKVLKEEGVNSEALETLSGKELQEEDLDKLVGGLNSEEIKAFAIKGLKYGAYAAGGLIAIAGAAGGVDYAIRGESSLPVRAGKSLGILK